MHAHPSSLIQNYAGGSARVDGSFDPVFVTVHAKIARGAFARWVIQNRIESEHTLERFAELGCTYDATASTPHEPVFIAHKFKGLGLSVRTTSR